MSNQFIGRVCNKCNYTFFGITHEHAQCEIDAFNKMVDALSEEQKNTTGYKTKSTIESYMYCHCGNSYKNFRYGNTAPLGATINSILVDTEILE